jgi:hypothetical protein
MPDTAVLPVPPATGLALRRDRCVIEVSVLRLPMLRARLTATGGHWTPGSEFTVTVTLPFSRGTATFTAAEVTEEVVIDGRIAGREVRLRGDVRCRDDDSLVIWAAGISPPPRRRPRQLGRLARALAGRRLRVEIAMEFTR